MKKVLALSMFAVLGVAALSSCKKDYACECEDDFYSYEITGATKAQAETAELACKAQTGNCTWSKK